MLAKEDDFRAVYELNVFAVFRLTKAVVRQMIRHEVGPGDQHLFGRRQVRLRLQQRVFVVEGGRAGLHKSVARETAALGITSNAICPWHVDTELVREAMGRRAKMFGKNADEYLQGIIDESPQKRLIEAREVGALSVFLMSPEARGITGPVAERLRRHDDGVTLRSHGAAVKTQESGDEDVPDRRI